MSLVQITKHEGRIERVKKGETPIIELGLYDSHKVISADLQSITRYDNAGIDRKTEDWKYVVYTEVRV